MNPGFDAFESMVRDLWRKYHDSVQPMWNSRLYQYPLEDIGAALRRYRADYPDDTKPVWKTIYATLAGGDKGTGKSELRILLDSVRRAIASDPAWRKHPSAQSWSDSEVFENHIDANVRPTLYQPNGSPHPDPGGRRAKLAAGERAIMANRFIRDLKERGEPVPAWLVR